MGTIATCATALLVAYALNGFPFVTDYSRAFDSGVFPDVLHERATAWEAIFGDPYRPVGEIMADHGYPGFDGGEAARPPGAFLLQGLLLLIPESMLMPVVTGLVLILAFAVLRLTHLVSNVEWRRMIWVGPLLFLSLPVVTAISYGSLTVILTVDLILVSWAFRERSWAGIPLGIATASRLWPALAIFGFWMSGRSRAAYQASLVFLLVTAAGLLLPGVTASGTVNGLLAGSDAWMNHSQNASLALVVSRFEVPVIVAVVAASLVGVWLALRNKPQAIAITVVAALLASPLSWPTYTLAALPAGALWWRRGRTAALAVLASPLLLWFILPARWRGHFIFASLVVMLVLVSQMEPRSAAGYAVEDPS
jgi:hypothetical protein